MNAMLRKLAFPAVLFSALLLVACQDMGMKPMTDKSLYDRLGGKSAITAVVDDFVGNVAADKRINGFFAKANVPRLKGNLVDQICQATGDRKSTRLNSSHLVISYAVFCLKKQ